jgi:excinuclease ABC subunit C
MPPFPLDKVPHQPGCYLYQDQDKHIIYIGKAKDLRKRVGSYFAKEHADPKTQLLVKNIASVDFQVTRTEQEAFLLEANLIKKHQPKYNLELKGGKRYAYLLLTDEKFPRLLTSRDTLQKGQRFGPFASGYDRTALLYALRKAFFIRTCTTLPKKPCLRYHLGLCKAPCAGFQTKEEYEKNIKQAEAYLKGGSEQILKELGNKMRKAATSENYEEARSLRDQLAALESLREGQIAEQASDRSEDAVVYSVKEDGTADLVVCSVRNGMLGDKDEYTIDAKEGFLDEFIRRYYEEKGAAIPKRILLPIPIDESTAVYLASKANHQVEILVPQRGVGKSLLELAHANLEALKKTPGIAAEGLREALGLPITPRTIECIDISHLQGTDTVGSLVRFTNGVADKKNYRRFRIRTVEGIDDFRSMQEVVGRRYKRLVEEHKPLPDLLVVDGGAEQLAFARKALEELGIDLPAVGLAKKDEEIYLSDQKNPLRLPKSSPSLRLLMAARDEAHRFGVNYQRLLRSKRMKE